LDYHLPLLNFLIFTFYQINPNCQNMHKSSHSLNILLISFLLYRCALLLAPYKIKVFSIWQIWGENAQSPFSRSHQVKKYPIFPAPIVEERKPLVPLPSPKPTPPRVIPSPVEEIQLEKPRPIRAVERELGSRQSLATVVSRRSESPQRAQHAFYR
jgi:hypothetical protein